MFSIERSNFTFRAGKTQTAAASMASNNSGQRPASNQAAIRSLNDLGMT